MEGERTLSNGEHVLDGDRTQRPVKARSTQSSGSTRDDHEATPVVQLGSGVTTLAPGDRLGLLLLSLLPRELLWPVRGGAA
jgi:hypothetical protein